jgi:hypothetical protein
MLRHSTSPHRTTVWVAVAIVALSSAAGAQIWVPGTYNGQSVTFPRDTIFDNPARYGEALPSSIRDLPILRRVADAEAEGARFPWRPITDSARAAYVTRNAATGGRRCVTAPAGQNVDVVAGDFEVGGRINGSRGSDIYWSPMHDPSLEAQGLLVRFARIDSAATPADTHRVVQLRYKGAFSLQVSARNHPAGPHPLADIVGRAAEPFFWSSMTVPSAGTWMAVATSGTDWGCVIFDSRR